MRFGGCDGSYGGYGELLRSLVVTNLTSSNVSITGGTITGTNSPDAVGEWAVPVISGPTGTMGNNGAVTWGTALPNAYTGGAWVIVPIGAIAAGTPAAISALWYVGTDTTHGTFYNAALGSGVPRLGTATPFATIGPGAFTGVTSTVSAIVLPVAGNTIGANGQLRAGFIAMVNNTAGGKTVQVIWNSVVVLGQVGTTGWFAGEAVIANRGATNVQVGGDITEAAVGTNAPIYTTADTTASQNVTFTITKSIATDVLVVELGFLYRQYVQ